MSPKVHNEVKLSFLFTFVFWGKRWSLGSTLVPGLNHRHVKRLRPTPSCASFQEDPKGYKTSWNASLFANFDFGDTFGLLLLWGPAGFNQTCRAPWSSLSPHHPTLSVSTKIWKTYTSKKKYVSLCTFCSQNQGGLAACVRY